MLRTYILARQPCIGDFLDLPQDLKTMEKEINLALQAKKLDVVFSVTSYNSNSDTQAFTYSVLSKNSCKVPSKAQKIIDKYLRERRESIPSFVEY